MSLNSAQISLPSDQAHVLQDLHPDEICLVLIPTGRVDSRSMVKMLRQNNVVFRSLGRGAGTVRKGLGRILEAKDVLLLATRKDHVTRARLYARLAGVESPIALV